MAIVKAEVKFVSGTGLPKDDCTNAFHFDVGLDPFGDYSPDLTNQLADFYDATPTGGTGSIASRWRTGIFSTTAIVSFFTTTVATGVETPVGQTDFTLATMAASGDAMPAEVAIRCSVHGTITGVQAVDRQRRGGPFLGGAFLASVGFVNSGRMSVDADLVTDITLAAKDLQAAVDGDGRIWVVYSKAAGTTFPIVGGFCDNAFDTIKRRGPAPTSRTLWSA